MWCAQVALKIIRKAALRTARTLELLANEMKVSIDIFYILYELFIYYMYELLANEMKVPSSLYIHVYFVCIYMRVYTPYICETWP